MPSSWHFPKPLSTICNSSSWYFFVYKLNCSKYTYGRYFLIVDHFSLFCHLLKWCRAIIKLCRADFSSKQISSRWSWPQFLWLVAVGLTLENKRKQNENYLQIQNWLKMKILLSYNFCYQFDSLKKWSY